jgi:hypothetical protein
MPTFRSVYSHNIAQETVVMSSECCTGSWTFATDAQTLNSSGASSMRLLAALSTTRDTAGCIGGGEVQRSSEGIEPSFCGVCGEAGGDASALSVERGKGRTDRQGRARATFCDVTLQPYTPPPPSPQSVWKAWCDSECILRFDRVVFQAVSSFPDGYQQSHEP